MFDWQTQRGCPRKRRLNAVSNLEEMSKGSPARIGLLGKGGRRAEPCCFLIHSDEAAGVPVPSDLHFFTNDLEFRGAPALGYNRFEDLNV